MGQRIPAISYHEQVGKWFSYVERLEDRRDDHGRHQAAIFVEGGSEKVDERLMLRQALLLIEIPLGWQLFVLSGRSGREYDTDPV